MDRHQIVVSKMHIYFTRYLFIFFRYLIFNFLTTLTSTDDESVRNLLIRMFFFKLHFFSRCVKLNTTVVFVEFSIRYRSEN